MERNTRILFNGVTTYALQGVGLGRHMDMDTLGERFSLVWYNRVQTDCSFFSSLCSGHQVKLNDYDFMTYAFKLLG